MRLCIYIPNSSSGTSIYISRKADDIITLHSGNQSHFTCSMWSGVSTIKCSKDLVIERTGSTVVDNPFASPDSEGVILVYLQIIHRLGARHDFPGANHTNPSICTQHMHPNFDLSYREKS